MRHTRSPGYSARPGIAKNAKSSSIMKNTISALMEELSSTWKPARYVRGVGAKEQFQPGTVGGLFARGAVVTMDQLPHLLVGDRESETPSSVSKAGKLYNQHSRLVIPLAGH